MKPDKFSIFCKVYNLKGSFNGINHQLYYNPTLYIVLDVGQYKFIYMDLFWSEIWIFIGFKFVYAGIFNCVLRYNKQKKKYYFKTHSCHLFTVQRRSCLYQQINLLLGCDKMLNLI